MAGTRCLGPDIWAVFESLRMMVGLRRGGNIATAIQESGRKAIGQYGNQALIRMRGPGPAE